MAHGTKAAAAPTASSNGVAGSHPPPPAGVNRKKQKRREKEAAKKAAEAQKAKNGIPHPAQQPAQHHAPPAHQQAPQYAELDYQAEYDDGPSHEDEGDFYSEDAEDGDYYEQPYPTNGHYQSGYAPDPVSSDRGKKGKNKKKSQPPPQPAYSHPPLRAPHNGRKPNANQNRIWNTTTQEERERIREFWLSLGEDERKSLVKIEKEAVLRKMKEQQKHSCSCTVCGRKRTAIEEELEVLYDAYYEELEQAPRPIMTTHPSPGHYDDADDFSADEEEGDQDFSNSEISSEDDYSEEDRSLPPPETADFLRFGNSLQVKGGILTVADDLLKNDGKKFIEMMEQLAERRMQREEEAQYQAHPSMYPNRHAAHPHNPPPPPPEEDEFDDEEDDEEGYEDGDYEDEDEDEEDTMTEEQRMEEGRRMFQIFAARMFEQRVLQAYREKVAKERQEQLLQELFEEDQLKEAKDAKKAKEAAKRKEKKEKQKQQKLEEKLRKEAEQAAKEAELKAAEEKRQEEQRKKKEEQRKKKEAERKAQEEEKQRKEAERLKRQQEDRERQQEAERKAREHKLQEKKAREEAKRKEREEREAKEKDAREKKAQEEKERRDREAKARAEKERVRKEEQAATAAQNAATAADKKNLQPVAVALPPQLLKQTSSTGIPSPHVTPAVPKAPTPSRPRQSSQQGSHGSSPKPSYTAPGTSKSMSPASQAQVPIVPKSILTKVPTSQQPTPAPPAQPASPMPPIGPPPGMSIPPGMGIGNMQPGLNGFPGQGSMVPGMMAPGRNLAMFPPQPGAQAFRPFPPPGMHGPNPMPMGRGFPMDGPPPGFAPMQGFPAPSHPPGFGMAMASHSRQTSGSFDKQSAESPIAPPGAHPIQRPAPIQRPSSVKPHGDTTAHSDVDELASHLGSKALLADDDEEELDDFNPTARRRRQESLRGAPLGFGFPEVSGPPRPDVHGPFASSSNASVWGTPPMGSIPFPLQTSGWGASPTTNLFNSPFSMMASQRTNEQRGTNEQRLVWLRRIVCSTCKMLSLRQPGTDGYVDAQEVHNHIESARGPTEPTVTLTEIKEACDIIGDSSNGGGSLEYKESSPGRLSHIKFMEAGGAPPPTLGEIGSPIPSHSVPVGGFGAGRPFPGLGPQAF